MRTLGLAIMALGLMAPTPSADEQAAARKVVDEAIAAHGGEDAIAKWASVTALTEGIFHGYDRTPAFLFTSEITNHGAEQWRHVLDGKLFGKSFQIANVLDAGQGWIKQAGDEKKETRPFTPAELADCQEDAYRAWASTLVPLRGAEFTLTLGGEEDVGDRPATKVRVSSKGHRDVTLFFGKESKLLVKTETRARAGTPVVGKVETFLRQHKSFEGVQRPTMMTVYHDGRQIISHWVKDYRVEKELAAGMFAKP